MPSAKTDKREAIETESVPFWRSAATEQDIAAFGKAGFGQRAGFGRKPAVLVIDATRGYIDPKYARGGGDYPASAVANIAVLLGAARKAGVPVIFFKPGIRTRLAAGGRARKSSTVVDPKALNDPAAQQWPDEIAPLQSEAIIEKTKSSAFFETPLRSMLTFLEVDTVILTGLSTSGCIQAAALDASSCNLHVVVPEECVGDRAPTFHHYALFNIDMRYGDVMPLAQVLTHLDKMHIASTAP